MPRYLACFLLGVGIVFACSSPKQVERIKGGGSGGSGNGTGGTNVVDVGSGGTGIVCDPFAEGSLCGPDAPAPPGCGDGELTEDEACDDGNRDADDGCAANCLFVEKGYSCNPPGQPCHEIAKCGDGLVAASEPCDDGNATAGDGCSPRCKLEIGFKCDGEPSSCVATLCGDGVLEGAESCEDGNAVPFDGCSSLCQTEPNCADGPCVSECGDGLVLDEDCDDANTIDGDGCSSTCTIEAGYRCSVDIGCEMLDGACILRVPVVYRDFTATHDDFGLSDGGGQYKDCKGTVVAGESAATPGLVEDLLVNGKPVAAATAPADGCIRKIGEWFTDAGSPAIVRDIVLYDNEDGGFVNRFGPNGQQFGSRPIWTGTRHCGPAGSMCEPANGEMGCVLAPGEQCYDPCVGTDWGNQPNQACASAVTVDENYDGTPLFFPIDDVMTTERRFEAKVPPQYGYNWEFEDQAFPLDGVTHTGDNSGAANHAGALVHNFYFSTEVVYWFKFDPTTAARLDFTGDDDVWVFVNGHLAVDLGGVHQPVDGSVTIDATTADTYALEEGKVYAITIFQAERRIESSSFRLTLAGFKTNRSECEAVCGDGIVGLGEQCDDGTNDGGYGECAEHCVLGEYCGDGIVQEGEDCDDGNTIDGDTCGSSCRILVVK